MAQLFTNNAKSTLASAISSTAGSLSVSTGDGSKFPSPTGNDFFLVSLEINGFIEIVRVTARTGDTFTITRGQENTTPSAFDAGSTVELNLTAGALSQLVSATTHFRGDYDVSTNSLPANPLDGDIYHLSGTGVVNGVTYRDGDVVLYTDSNGWVKMSGQGLVYSVAGKTGNVVLTPSDVQLSFATETQAQNAAQGVLVDPLGVSQYVTQFGVGNDRNLVNVDLNSVPNPTAYQVFSTAGYINGPPQASGADGWVIHNPASSTTMRQEFWLQGARRGFYREMQAGTWDFNWQEIWTSETLNFASNTESLEGTSATVMSNPAGVAAYLKQFGLGEYNDSRDGMLVTGVPSDIYSKGFRATFADGGPGSGSHTGLAIPQLGSGITYGVLLINGQYTDSSGGAGSANRLFLCASGLFLQLETSATTWGTWRQVWDSGNFTPSLKADLASPALTGTPTAPTPATTTNSTQIATTAFSQSLMQSVGFGSGRSLGANIDLDTVVTPGVYRLEQGVVNGPTTFNADYCEVFVGHGSDTATQIIVSYSTGHMAYRAGNPTQAGGSGAWSPWRTSWDDGNFNPGNYLGLHATADNSNNLGSQPPSYYAPNSALSGYLPLHGTADNSNNLGSQPPSYYAPNSALSGYLPLHGTADQAVNGEHLLQGGNGSAMTFNWSGQSGQPTYLWGGNDGINMYVYNPSNFSVSYATNSGHAGNSDELGGHPLSYFPSVLDFSHYLSGNGYIRLPYGVFIQWGYQGVTSQYGTTYFPTTFPTNCMSVVMTQTINADKFSPSITGKNASDFSWRVGGNYQSGINFYWIAVGY